MQGRRPPEALRARPAKRGGDSDSVLTAPCPVVRVAAVPDAAGQGHGRVGPFSGPPHPGLLEAPPDHLLTRSLHDLRADLLALRAELRGCALGGSRVTRCTELRSRNAAIGHEGRHQPFLAARLEVGAARLGSLSQLARLSGTAPGLPPTASRRPRRNPRPGSSAGRASSPAIRSTWRTSPKMVWCCARSDSRRTASRWRRRPPSRGTGPCFASCRRSWRSGSTECPRGRGAAQGSGSGEGADLAVAVSGLSGAAAYGYSGSGRRGRTWSGYRSTRRGEAVRGLGRPDGAGGEFALLRGSDLGAGLGVAD